MKVLLDKNMRFTGTYVLVGSIAIKNDDEKLVEVPSLPPTNDIEKQKFYRWHTYHAKTGSKKVPVMIDVQSTDKDGNLLFEDEENTIPMMISVQETDEDGNLLWAEEDIYENISEWVFDEEDYNNYINQKSEQIPPKTDKEKIEELEQELKNVKLSSTEIFEYILSLLK